jgi:FAD-linked oxidoreductase
MPASTSASDPWRNWAGNQHCRPAAVERPQTEVELARVVKDAAAAGRTVKAVGSGHSFTDVACTSGVQVVLDRYDRVLSVDREAGTVTVQAGVTLARLNEALAARGLALPNLGDIAYQTVAGAISTSTHGTGVRLGGLATQVVGLQLVVGDGSVLTCSAEEERELFEVARVGLGALGLVSTVTLQCVPAFNLRAVEEPLPVDEVLEALDEHVEANDHFEFYWVPHTRWALTKRNNRTDAPVGGRSRWQEWRAKVLMENVAFGAVCHLGRLRPAWIPGLARALPASGRVEYVDRSDRVFTSPRHVRFCEMEYAVPRAAAVEVVQRLRAFVDEAGLLLNFPVEVRFTAADDVPLSTASGRESCYVAVHVFQGMPHEQYFRGVEAIMDEAGGRPHWGKLHYQDAASLAPRYPGWDRFREARRRVDPEGRFANPYLDRVLGPVG